MTFVRNYKNYLIVLGIIVLVKASLVCYMISIGGFSLHHNEAQYWIWSRHLDFGFYSKPPGIAWQIYLGCKLLGQTELGVRFFSVILASLMPITTYYFVFKMNLKPAICFWAGLIQTLTPIGILAAFSATTDVGFIFFWLLALFPIVQAVQRDEEPNYLITGTFVLCGALFKWTMFAFWPIILISGLVFRKLYTPKIFSGFVISTLALLPTIFWNMKHEWATFRHVFELTTKFSHKGGRFFEFFAAQVGFLSPIFFILLMLALIEIIKQRKKIDKGLLLCGLVTGMILVFYFLYAMKKPLRGNWCVYAYPTSFIVIAWYANDVLSKGKRWLLRGSALSLSLVSLLAIIPFIHQLPHLSKIKLPYNSNPFLIDYGWNKLSNEFKELSEQRDSHYFFSNSYVISYLLSFYGPQKRRQYFLNTSNVRRTQFSFWPSLADDHKGESGYCVLRHDSKRALANVHGEKKRIKKMLSPYFENVEFVKIIPLYKARDKLLKGVMVFYCENYNGRELKSKSKY